MNKREAYRIIEKFSQNDNPTEYDIFAFIEASNFIIETENDSNVMSYLGGYYYEQQKYDLAEKYYLMADENGDKWAADGLGYIYYYGRNGERDYKKAFHYFSKAKANGNLEAAMKIADMYRNGYGVQQSLEQYKAIIVELYDKLKDTKDLFEPYPEVAHRLGEILINEGKGESAIEMLLKGKSFIQQRIRYNAFWGNFIVCRRTINLLYKVIPFSSDDFDLFDLFYYLSKPNKATLIYNGKTYPIESFFDEGEIRVKFLDKNYKSIENFLSTALINGKHLYVIHYEDYYDLSGNE